MSAIPKIIDFKKDTRISQLTLIDDVDKNFESTKKEFTDYYKVQAFYDMENGIGKTWVLKYNGKVLGFISVAMAHMEKERTTYFEGKKSDANIPALLIGHLATHKDALRRGIGKELVKWAIREAVNNSERIGCRIVMLNPEDDQIVKSFYIA